MTIRRRLTIAIAGVLLVTLLVLGVAIVRTTRDTLVGQIDEQLVGFDIKRGDGYGYPQPGNGNEVAGESGVGNGTDANSSDKPPSGPQYRLYFELDLGPDGTERRRESSGYSSDPDPPPAIPGFGSDTFTDLVARKEMTTIEAEDGSFDYRLHVQRSPDGGYHFTATSLESVDNAIHELIRTMVLASLIALAAAIALSSVLIRRGLRPVDRMVDTAQRIAGGNLSSRVPNPDSGTELGRLGMALNEMMTHIETADAERSAGEQRLRRFVADAAHELRTPLTSVRGYAELYRQGALVSADGIAGAMARIESEGARMARLVDDLLLLARLDQQRGVEQVPVDLSALVTDALTDFRVIEPERLVSHRIDDRIEVRGDQLRLRQIVDNLLSNVRTHTPAGSAVDVALRRAGDTSVLEVTDHGPGISTGDRNRVFERFWRADPARTRSRGGTGLGLAIVASLVDAHAGSIEIDGEPGQGTTFRIRLPIVQETPRHPA